MTVRIVFEDESAYDEAIREAMEAAWDKAVSAMIQVVGDAAPKLMYIAPGNPYRRGAVMSGRCCEHDKCPGGSLCCCPPKPFREIARAEAERRWPDTGTPPTTAPLALAWHDTGMASGFVLGALWATEVTDEMVESGSRTCVGGGAESGSAPSRLRVRRDRIPARQGQPVPEWGRAMSDEPRRILTEALSGHEQETP